jgi:hypothetical protein
MNRLLDARRSGVQLSLIIFDLAGITEFAQVDAFPPLPVRDVIAANHRCYSPMKWDSYSTWSRTPCDIKFGDIETAFDHLPISPAAFWLRQIWHHPIAYAQHRITYFLLSIDLMQITPLDTSSNVIPDRAVPNDWGYEVASNPWRVVIHRAACVVLVYVGRPFLSLLLAAGLMWWGRRLPSRAVILPIAASALLYGLSYLAMGVAVEPRYYLWTTIATLIALTIAIADLGNARARHLFRAFARRKSRGGRTHPGCFTDHQCPC